jgi:dolichol-phosphate mannosyltransferase
MSQENLNPWVVIPTYNERSNISKMIDLLFSLPIKNLSVLIVDDSSPDGTSQIIVDHQKKYPDLHLLKRTKKNGLGRAYIDGFAYAIDHGASIIVQMDADFSHNPKDVPRLISELASFDLVLGSRYCHGISVVNWPMRRLILSTLANAYAGLVTGLPFKDSTGGFRAWRASLLKRINLRQVNVDGYGFQIALLYKAWKLNSQIKEIPIIFTERREGQSKMSKSIIFEAIWLVWKLRFFG